MEEEDLVAQYRAEAEAAMLVEANKRIAEKIDPEEEEILRNTSLISIVSAEIDNDVNTNDKLVNAIFARLGSVRAALDGHGGGIVVQLANITESGLDLTLKLDGACLSCGAAPGTLQAIKNDLISDNDVFRVRFSASLLDLFDDLGREFILTHGGVEFV